jgi:ubiquinone/menaquinone biosynthesis C-methylase UbiE
MSGESVLPADALIDIDVDAELDYTRAMGSANIRRWLYLRYSEVDVYEEIYKSADLQGHEDVLDLACGDGITTLRVYGEGRHRGRIVGIDFNPDNFVAAAVKAYKNGWTNLEFRESDARALELPDTSFDTVFFNFGIYHMEGPQEAVEEINRVLKPGGRAIVATRSRHNLAKLYNFGGLIAKRLDQHYPGTPYPNCDFDKTKELLDRFIDGHQVSFEEINKPLEIPVSGYEDYLVAVVTQLNRMQPKAGSAPIPAGAKSVVEEIVRPAFEDEINQNGYFTEYQSHGIFVVKKAA